MGVVPHFCIKIINLEEQDAVKAFFPPIKKHTAFPDYIGLS
jgi:hypothetical protein